VLQEETTEDMPGCLVFGETGLTSFVNPAWDLTTKKLVIFLWKMARFRGYLKGKTFESSGANVFQCLQLFHSSCDPFMHVPSR
jgi:hypothetical protein